ncbi:hypothetical protein CN330_26050 [Priestia megaterium]|nr:hypothetical protein CN330_26050 [Priestia megaterium]
MLKLTYLENNSKKTRKKIIGNEAIQKIVLLLYIPKKVISMEFVRNQRHLDQQLNILQKVSE